MKCHPRPLKSILLCKGVNVSSIITFRGHVKLSKVLAALMLSPTVIRVYSAILNTRHGDAMMIVIVLEDVI